MHTRWSIRKPAGSWMRCLRRGRSLFLVHWIPGQFSLLRSPVVSRMLLSKREQRPSINSMLGVSKSFLAVAVGLQAGLVLPLLSRLGFPPLRASPLCPNSIVTDMPMAIPHLYALSSQFLERILCLPVSDRLIGRPIPCTYHPNISIASGSRPSCSESGYRGPNKHCSQRVCY